MCVHVAKHYSMGPATCTAASQAPVSDVFGLLTNFCVWLLAGHCKRLAPAWGELATFFKDHDNIRIAHVDCTTDRDVCTTADVGGCFHWRLLLLYMHAVHVQQGVCCACSQAEAFHNAQAGFLMCAALPGSEASDLLLCQIRNCRVRTGCGQGATGAELVPYHLKL